MPDKRVATFSEAVAGILSGQTIMVGGFGGAGVPLGLIGAVLAAGPRDLTVISNNAGFGPGDLSEWLKAGMVRKVVCTYPRTSPDFVALYRQGKVELELIPQGTLTERMRCAGAGLGGFFSPVSAGTALAAGKEERIIDGRPFVFEAPLRADVALIRGRQGDPQGNVTYNKTARNFAPAMASAATLVVVEVVEIVETGGIDPEHVVTPGMLVDRVVQIGSPS